MNTKRGAFSVHVKLLLRETSSGNAILVNVKLSFYRHPKQIKCQLVMTKTTSGNVTLHNPNNVNLAYKEQQTKPNDT